MQFTVLGEVGVRGADGLIEVQRPQRRAVLAYLLLNARQQVTLDRLMDAVWADEAPSSARTQIHGAVSTLRQTLRGTDLADCIRTTADGYTCAVADGELDLLAFRSQVREATGEMSGRRVEQAARILRAALGLWRGTPLAGVNAAFVEPARARLHEERLDACQQLAACELGLGREAELVPMLTELVEANPHREQLVGQLLIALYRTGRQAEAVRRFDAARRFLADELGLDPGPELAAIHTAILRGDPELTPSATAAASPAFGAAVLTTAPPPPPRPGATPPAGATPAARATPPADAAPASSTTAPPEVSPEAPPEVSPEAPPQVLPQTLPEAPPQAPPQASPQAPPQASDPAAPDPAAPAPASLHPAPPDPAAPGPAGRRPRRRLVRLGLSGAAIAAAIGAAVALGLQERDAPRIPAAGPGVPGRTAPSSPSPSPSAPAVPVRPVPSGPAGGLAPVRVFNIDGDCRTQSERLPACRLGLAKNPYATYDLNNVVPHRVWHGDVLMADCIVPDGTRIEDEHGVGTPIWFRVHLTDVPGGTAWFPAVRTHDDPGLPVCAA